MQDKTVLLAQKALLKGIRGICSLISLLLGLWECLVYIPIVFSFCSVRQLHFCVRLLKTKL